jgi:plasmid stabilization system protein ParE
MKPIAYHPEASAELEDAIEVYEEQREGRGRKFRLAVERAEKEIQRAPKSSPRYGRTKCREYSVRRFPYAIYYDEHDDYIEIVAVSRGRRRRGYWLKRIRE